jgi:hypothetical protein
MTACGFGEFPVPSIKVGPTNTSIVSLFVVSNDKDNNDDVLPLGIEEKIMPLDA